MTEQDAAIIATRKTLHEALELQQAGNLAAAAQRYELVVNAGYRVTDVLPILAGILAWQGNLDGAIARWDALLAIAPDHAVGWHEKALVLDRLGRREEAVPCLRTACSLDPNNAIAANNFAVLLADTGRKDEALVEFRRALALQPDNVHIRHQIRRLSADQVPFWHIPMMNDTRRNDAFEAAIKQAIAKVGPSARLLDIGTGSGLLALMAARAGAGSVDTCEVVPVIAEAARRIIAANGYGERIALHAKSSTELKIGAELDERVDILVSEILSSDLLTENVLATFEDAHDRLLKRDAIVIPRAARAFGCLVESETLSRHIHVDSVSGFDLSPFGELATRKLAVHGTMTDWTRLSADVELVHIDLMAHAHPSEVRALSIPVTADGIACGIVQWMHIDLAEGVTFDNHPDQNEEGGWLQILHSFPAPVAVRAGETLEVAVGHDRATLIVQPLAARSQAAIVKVA